MILHTPWALYICERTPMAIEFTQREEELAAQLDAGRAETSAA
jgi:hypothetical protein